MLSQIEIKMTIPNYNYERFFSSSSPTCYYLLKNYLSYLFIVYRTEIASSFFFVFIHFILKSIKKHQKIIYICICLLNLKNIEEVSSPF